MNLHIVAMQFYNSEQRSMPNVQFFFFFTILLFTEVKIIFNSEPKDRKRELGPKYWLHKLPNFDQKQNIY